MDALGLIETRTVHDASIVKSVQLDRVKMSGLLEMSVRYTLHKQRIVYAKIEKEPVKSIQ